MSKALCSYPEGERKAVIARRLKNKTGGNGYWAAVDAQKRASEKAVKKAEIDAAVTEQ